MEVGSGWDDGAAAAVTNVNWTRNSKELDTKTSTEHDDATDNSIKQNHLKENCEGSYWFRYDDLILFLWLFVWMIGDKKTDLIYGCEILTEQPEN